MAEKRMICKSISVSEDVNFLPDIFDMLMFTWMIPHSDDFGRLPGSPAKVKAIVVPMLDKSVKEIEESLRRLQGSALINWYEVSGEKFIQLVTFEKHQSGLHKRTKSKFPEPPDHSRKFPEIPLEENRTELNRTEEKGVEKSDDQDLILSRINALGLKCKGEFELSKVYSFIGTMQMELIIESLDRSEHIKKVSYALGILQDWSISGFKTLEDIKPKRQLQPISNKEAEIQRRLADERKNAEPIPFKPEFEKIDEVGA